MSKRKTDKWPFTAPNNDPEFQAIRKSREVKPGRKRPTISHPFPEVCHRKWTGCSLKQPVSTSFSKLFDSSQQLRWRFIVNCILLFFLNCCDAENIAETCDWGTVLDAICCGNLSDVLRQLRRYALAPPRRNDPSRDVTQRLRAHLETANVLVRLRVRPAPGQRDSPVFLASRVLLSCGPHVGHMVWRCDSLASPLPQRPLCWSLLCSEVDPAGGLAAFHLRSQSFSSHQRSCRTEADGWQRLAAAASGRHQARRKQGGFQVEFKAEFHSVFYFLFCT